jgi:diguanylate cyclase (GGDEF)-like protein
LPILLLTVLALHLGLLLPQFQKAARTDSKTGLATLEFWHQFAGRELARAQATHATLGILIIDLDHFKQINDRHGHLSGDHVLRAVAKAMRSEVRSFDLIARFGGEEFAILMPGITADGIVPAAERVSLAINQVTVTVESIGGGTVTIDKLTASVGAALYPATATDLTALVMSADTALYAAKDNGRNQARLAPSEGIPDSLNPI